MDYTSSITTETFLKLKCHLCSNPLSHFPVYMSDRKHVCGRCSSCLDPATFAQNDVYEALAKFVQFPCRYKQDGCRENLLPKDVPQHEENCEYKKSKCPLQEYAACGWAGPQASILYHCQEKHGELFLKNGTFELDLSLSCQRQNLLQCNSHLFAVKQKFFSINKLLELSICKVGDDVDSGEFSCAVNFGTTNMNLTAKCYNAVFVEKQPVEIFLDSLTERNGQSLVTAKITLEKFEKDMPTIKKVDHKFLNLLRCATCLEYTLPPIYYQDTINILDEKPMHCEDCRLSFGVGKAKPNTRNFILEQMANLMNYPCKNTKNGCSFIAKPPKMKRHQDSCPYGNHRCPLTGSCLWTGLGRNLNGHILDTHSKMIISSEPISENLPYAEPFAKGINFDRCYVIKFLDRLFRLNFVVKAARYKWNVEIIGPFESGFMFEVKIVDNNNGKSSLVAKEPCVSLSRTDIADGGIYFNLDQIVHMLKYSRTITFEVRVFM